MGKVFQSLSTSLKMFYRSQNLYLLPHIWRIALWVASPGFVYSPIDGRIAGSMSLKTDGEWAWQDTMAHYVREHRICPPWEFVQHVRRKSYIPPSEEDVDVTQLDFPEDFS